MEYIMQGVLMMNIGIYYFTRTGNCKRIAEKIAARLHLHPYTIEDDEDWKGFKVYFKFQSYAKGKKELKLHYEGDPRSMDRIILVSPVWGSRMPPTVKKFLENIPLKKVDMIASSKIDSMRGIDACHACVQIKQFKKQEDMILREYLDSLSSQLE